MDPETISEWYKRQSYNVIKTEGHFWLEVIPHIVQSFPFHWLINPEMREIESLWFKHNIYGVRFSQSLDGSNGKISYHVVFPLDGEKFTLDGVRKKPRYDIRKGLRNFKIGPISMNSFRVDGWSVRLETLSRQKRIGAESKTWWQRMCVSAEGLPGFEAWAAYAGNIMAASALVIRCENYCYIYYQQSRTNYLGLGVNNSLVYAITSEMLSRPGIKKVFYGLESLDARPSVDQFKFRMGFEAQPVKQTVIFHPYIAPLVNPISHSLLSSLGKAKPGFFFSKAEGMFRFYLDGKKENIDPEIPEVNKKKGNGYHSIKSWKK